MVMLRRSWRYRSSCPVMVFGVRGASLYFLGTSLNELHVLRTVQKQLYPQRFIQMPCIQECVLVRGTGAAGIHNSDACIMDVSLKIASAALTVSGLSRALFATVLPKVGGSQPTSISPQPQTSVCEIMVRLSGLQKDVLSLYRQCLRAVRQKPIVCQLRFAHTTCTCTLLT